LNPHTSLCIHCKSLQEKGAIHPLRTLSLGRTE
jgi:hypothetical protein